MKGNSFCDTCGVEFGWTRSKNQSTPKYCSMKCRGHTGFIPGGEFRTSNESYDQKLERTKNNYEKHVIKREGCWGWKGSIEKNGYARLSCRDIAFRHAHTASYFFNLGKIKEGNQVNHLCNNRSCSNPLHLYEGTQKENMRDKILSNRQAKGSKNGNSKLCEEDVIKIKYLLENGETTHVIGKLFNISEVQIGNIKNGKQWTHVT